MWEQGRTSSEVAYESGVSHRTMTEYLAARRDLRRSPDHWARLAETLDVEPEDLVGPGAFDPEKAKESTRQNKWAKEPT